MVRIRACRQVSNHLIGSRINNRDRTTTTVGHIHSLVGLVVVRIQRTCAGRNACHHLLGFGIHHNHIAGALGCNEDVLTYRIVGNTRSGFHLVLRQIVNGHLIVIANLNLGGLGSIQGGGEQFPGLLVELQAHHPFKTRQLDPPHRLILARIKNHNLIAGG